jgi:hypothetical protein
MFPLPFSISPLLLSVLVFYPWALALGVWQIGKNTSKTPRSTPSASRSAFDLICGDQNLLSSIDPSSDDQTAPCGVIEPPYVPPAITAILWKENALADPWPYICDPSVPSRAPPSIA